MSEVSLDCQGLPCPQPVLQCKKTIEEGGPERIIVTVDNDAAKENVTRFMTLQGYSCTSEGDGPIYKITGIKNNDAKPAGVTAAPTTVATQDGQKILVFLGTDVVGSGDDELGSKLMLNFLLTLKEMGEDLWRIVMLNGGVKLSVEGHPCLEPLKELEKAGVSILVCGTCLEFFRLSGQNGVGEVTNMLDIVTSFQLASKVVRV
ncbi:sulfurtransferase-like selenium metabolism protein YedF [Pseudodesulfovibrio sp.]|uniref:sulfurtransferase-like selenium metabolism protein YedF n=1 Tax=unclassified Pseudodesulfovibrio TaxID=2661612 RepID=UPI003AFF67E4